MPHIDRQQLRKFAEDGYIVLSQVVSPGLIRAARSAVADRLRQDPPPAGHRGPHFYFLFHDLPDALLAPLYQSPAIDLAGSLLAAGASFDTPEHIQISLNIPPWSHRPGGPHIDGITPPERDGRPGTFTMLAGIFLTDQSQESAGNLWVWPGSHREAGAYFLEHGPESLISCTPYPPVPLQPPRQVTARAGDVLLAHYMLGHNMGGNTSGVMREVLYFRLRRTGHRDRWKQIVQDPFLEFERVRSVLTTCP